MASFLFRVLNRFRPREGWALFLLTLVALLCAPAALLQAARDPAGFDVLLLLTFLAVLIGLWLARSQLSARKATLWSGLLGGSLILIVVGRILPPFYLLWGEIGYAVKWLGQRQPDISAQPLPFARTMGYVWQQFNLLSSHLWWWGQAVADGKDIQDNIVFLLVAALLAWALALFATWQIYRRRSALFGLLPSGVVLATITFFGSGLTQFYLIAYLFCALWLVAICHLWTRRDHWEQTGTDYPGGLGMELVLTLSPALILILVLATFFPVVHPNQMRDAFWSVMDGPWAHVERVAEQLFGPIEGGYGGSGSGYGSDGQLPRSHLLGGRPELSETIVLYVRTNDPSPPPPTEENEPLAVDPAVPRRYWRATTYDVYTGQGWLNSPLESYAVPPNRPLQSNLLPGPKLSQQFQVVVPGEAIYGVNVPMRVDRAVQAWWRAPDDLAQLMGQQVDLYTIISHPPEPTIAELQANSSINSSLPPDVAQRYLALPDTIPQRVLDLAQKIAGEANTRYDRARAIEAYLRAYPYNLDLPNPPDDRDLVDYFLFDLQEGYCDYYASAMVVMARAVGVPARLATGYAQGTFDHDTERWVVAERDGHSWVEVYFDGIGWVEFEPTAGLPSLERPGGEDLAQIIVPPLPPHPTRRWQQVPWGLMIMGGALLIMLGFIAWLWRPRRQKAIATVELVRDHHARLLRWGNRLGHPLHDGQTPHEYSSTLGKALYARGQNSPLRPAHDASVKAPPAVERLTETFVRAQYSPKPPTHQESGQIRHLWIRLRRWLWWLWLAARFKR